MYTFIYSSSVSKKPSRMQLYCLCSHILCISPDIGIWNFHWLLSWLSGLNVEGLLYLGLSYESRRTQRALSKETFRVNPLFKRFQPLGCSMTEECVQVNLIRVVKARKPAFQCNLLGVDIILQLQNPRLRFGLCFIWGGRQSPAMEPQNHMWLAIGKGRPYSIFIAIPCPLAVIVVNNNGG